MRTRPRRPPARLLLLVAPAAAVLALAGCSGAGGAGGADGAARTGAAAPPPAGTAAPAPSAAPIATPGATRTVTSMTSFTSPSGNIGCFLAPVQGASPYARCDLREDVTWTEPEPESGCAGDWGGSGGRGSVGVGAEEAHVLCVGDTTVDPAAAVLPYGASVTLGDITCTSRETGMECDNATTGRGFTVSKARFLPH